MPKNYAHYTVVMPGEDYPKRQITLQDNPELYKEHTDIVVGEKLCIRDETIINTFTGEYALIPVICIYVEQDPRYPRCLWYYFRAVDDENECLNTLKDPKFEGLYYKILESTSPYIVK